MWLNIQKWGRWAAEPVTGRGRHVNTVRENSMLQRLKSPRLPTPFHVGMKMCLKTELWSYFSKLCQPDVEWPFSTWKKWLIFPVLPLSTNSSWPPSNRKSLPPLQKFLPFFPLVIKMFFVIYSIFQNMRVNLLLIEPGDTLCSENQCAGCEVNDYFSKCLSSWVEELWKSETDFSPCYDYLNSNSFPLQVIANCWA